MKLLLADHILPISSAPIRDGAVVIDGDRIVEVGSATDLTAKYTDAEITNFGRPRSCRAL